MQNTEHTAEATPHQTEIEAFYDSFMESRMLRYRIDTNLRLARAAETVLAHLEDTGVVADIGCGIGWMSEAVARARPNCKVFGFDLSDQNIEFARRSVDAQNVEFFVASVADQFHELKRRAGVDVDASLLVDVIEHIPPEARPDLFRQIADASTSDATLIICYPSPEYQRHLIAHEPSELQVTDYVVEIADLIAEAGLHGWNLADFSHARAWRENQYCHAIFKRRIVLGEERYDKPTLIQRAMRKFDRAVLRPARIEKYTRLAREVSGAQKS